MLFRSARKNGAHEWLLDAGVVSPRFAASPWGAVLPDALDRALGRTDWRSPIPPLISARVDDVDGAYAWDVVKGGGKEPATVIKLTSQSWRKPDEVSRQKWEHWLIVARPEELKTDKCFVMVSGGGNDGDKVPDGPGQLVRTIAEATGSLVVELKMIPNQPIVLDRKSTRLNSSHT